MIITVSIGTVMATIDTEHHNTQSPDGVQTMLRQCVDAALHAWQQKQTYKHILNQ